MDLPFEWDPAKAARNLRKHRVSFAEAQTVFADPFSLDVADPEHSMGEERMIVIGRSYRERFLVVVYEERERRASESSAHVRRPGESEAIMNRDCDTVTMRNEYDFSGGVRGKHARRYRKGREGWDDLFKSAAIQDVQTWLGHALLHVQELEATLVTYLALAWHESPGAAGRKAATLVENARGKTWSRLVTDLQEQGRATGDLEEQLRQLLNERHWLVHRSGYESESAVSHREDVIAFIDRLEAIADRSGVLEERIQELLERRLRAMGLSRKEIEDRREDVIRRWRAA